MVHPVQGGISTADRIVTVSPGYAWEIQTPEGGWGMEQMLGSRAYALNGVLNGIDTTDWNPTTDKHLDHKYGISNFSRGKVRASQLRPWPTLNREALPCQRSGLTSSRRQRQPAPAL